MLTLLTSLWVTAEDVNYFMTLTKHIQKKSLLLLPSCLTNSCISAMKLLQTQTNITASLPAVFRINTEESGDVMNSPAALRRKPVCFSARLGIKKHQSAALTPAPPGCSLPCSAQRHQKSEPDSTEPGCTHGTALVHLNTAPCLPSVWF